jgi:fluoroacetyl-CoA thioesterase
MKLIFKPGDKKVYRKTVTEADQAAFHNEVLHRVCSTFAMARDFEWSSRLFFIDMKEDHEEGVGTFLQIDHKSPAFVGEEIVFTATISALSGNELICDIEARVGDRLVASGKTGQKMLTREKLSTIFRQQY